MNGGGGDNTTRRKARIEPACDSKTHQCFCAKANCFAGRAARSVLT